ncbi:beta galactosidase jelly roll domain-containing protein [Aeoliella sp. ICT_H6.2]|uniref:Beta galactosidase jelly roll domain-containing protein n=1 Tax=Aeoliella straminimaris TaxID=2954799 RepID=A0A9X2JJS2_9BACT|nr:sugar-binding domain-containing protein [Aeoliella straminimaris]MCO6047098.1 beta galactosidase jelly roll domain-containing protein [Aeoliella straminimaris]
MNITYSNFLKPACLLALAAVPFTQLTVCRSEEVKKLRTRWADEVTPDNVLSEYPRPQLRRGQWWNLNGPWEYAVRPDNAEQPQKYDGEILVPFAIESQLSGVEKYVGYAELLWYRRSFSRPEMDDGERLLLNFGAVDWLCEVWVNGKKVGEHRGGYDPFTFDITDATVEGDNELTVAVWDPTDGGAQPRGKQLRRPHGIWYTSVTGIWQTVWLEKVPKSYLSEIKIVPHALQGSVSITPRGPTDEVVTIVVRDGDRQVATSTTRMGITATLDLPNPVLWSPQQPHLYDIELTTLSGDRVESYFGLRDVSVAKDSDGINRLTLNGEPLFQFGVLDQGWWPDGLYTAPTDEALRYDLEVAKRLGFNMIRKHVKVEPARWYYWCDKMGLMVWQDMPSGDRYIGGSEPDITRTDASADNFERELRRMVHSLYNHPSVVMWVPYNEGWGQWDTVRICQLLDEWDNTRLVNNASGWTDRGMGDVHDIHRYPGPAVPEEDELRASVLGEFGGLGLSVPEHTWREVQNWSYVPVENEEELLERYRKLLTEVRYHIGKGLAAAVYTQIADVEIELTGILTYDREVCKLPDSVRTLTELLYKSTAEIVDVVPTSEQKPQTWRYTFSNPGEDWQQPDYDDSSWRAGQGGFGGNEVHNAQPRTGWTTSDIWIRRSVDVSSKDLSRPTLRVYHDEDAEIYIQGKQVASLVAYTTEYVHVPLNEDVVELLKRGPVTIAVHCHQSLGDQFIDVGIVDFAP